MNSLAKSRSLYNIYLADFLKTNLRKFAVICVKRRQKARLLSPRSSKIKLTKKGKGERKSEERERRRRKKSNGFLVFITVTLETAHFDRLAEFFGNN